MPPPPHATHHMLTTACDANSRSVDLFAHRAGALSSVQWEAPRAPGKWAPCQEAGHLILSYRLFRQAFATTPHQYLIHRRIERAKELLRSRRISVTDVCFEVGFQSLGSFSSLFRRCVGDAPVNYREREMQSLSKVPPCFLYMNGLGLHD